MANIVFGNQKSDKIGPVVEEKLRKELGLSAPIPYTVEDAAAGKTSVGTVLKDMGSIFSGGQADLLFTLVFDISGPRPAKVYARVVRQGVGARVQELLFSTALSKPVKGEVMLEDPKLIGKPKFAGDDEAIKKLNSSGDLIKRANGFARHRSEYGGLVVDSERFFQIAPAAQGSMLVSTSLPRQIKMGFDSTLDAKEFFDIAALAEKVL
jgi:hypothetical protein